MISTHILDTSRGAPAQGVIVKLEKLTKLDNPDVFTLIESSSTNSDGRIVFSCPKEPGHFRLTFQIEAYFKSQGLTPFFLDTPIQFNIVDTDRKYHIPLLLNPYGLSTYRGS